MSRFSIPYALIFVALLSINNDSLRSQTTDVAGMPGSVFRFGFGARGIAMGNAAGAVWTGEVSGQYNPAVVPFSSTPTFSASWAFMSLDRRIGYLHYTRSLPPTAGLSFSVVSAGVDDIQGRDRSGATTEVYSTFENMFALSFANRFSEVITAGITAKLFYYRLFEKVSSTTVGIDLGMTATLSKSLKAGLTVQDIGSKYQWNTTPIYGDGGLNRAEYFPRRVRLSGAYISEWNALLIGAEFESIAGSELFRVGAEVAPLPWITFRAGLDQISNDDGLPLKPTVGIAVTQLVDEWTPSFQYTFVREPFIGTAMHIISISVSK